MKKFIIIGGVVIAILVLVFADKIVGKKAPEPVTTTQTEEEKKPRNKVGVDSSIVSSQDVYSDMYGKAPEGFLWDQGGALLSQGDKELSAEDVVYTFLRGTSTLDMATVERFSRDSKIVERFREDSSKTASLNSFKDIFLLNAYKEFLLSSEVVRVDNVSTFANNKQVFTVTIKAIDLGNKDFWLKEKDKLFKQIRQIDDVETDATKADKFIFEYIIDQYKKNREKLKKEFTISLTVQKFPDVDSGWLVSVDKELDSQAKNKDGIVLADYIKSQFREWLVQVKAEEQAKRFEEKEKENERKAKERAQRTAPAN